MIELLVKINESNVFILNWKKTVHVVVTDCMKMLYSY